MTLSNMTQCPCGSGDSYAACCGRLHAGAPASGPEALMRSRFSAFALQRSDYLLASWAPETRPADIPPDPDTRWQALTVVSARTQGDRGEVHFRAVSRHGAQWHCLEEHSRFRREGGHWFYIDGDPALTTLSPGRNSPCPCGSGAKFKRCCGG